MLREKSKTEAEKTTIFSVAITDEMAERIRTSMYNDFQKKPQWGKASNIAREALHRFLLWREENHDEMKRLLREERGEYGETALKYEPDKDVTAPPGWVGAEKGLTGIEDVIG